MFESFVWGGKEEFEEEDAEADYARFCGVIEVVLLSVCLHDWYPGDTIGVDFGWDAVRIVGIFGSRATLGCGLSSL